MAFTAARSNAKFCGAKCRKDCNNHGRVRTTASRRAEFKDRLRTPEYRKVESQKRRLRLSAADLIAQREDDKERHRKARAKKKKA